MIIHISLKFLIVLSVFNDLLVGLVKAMYLGLYVLLTTS